MNPTLLVDTFGSLIPIPKRVAPDPESPQQDLEGYLWSAFRNRSEHMRWSTRERSEAPGLWFVHEAELTHHLEASRIGFAQVGIDVNPATPDLERMRELEPPPDFDPSTVDPSQVRWAAVPTLDDAGPPTDPAIAISPLIQCLDDSLRWFGAAEISAYQVTGYDLQPRPVDHFFSSVLAWFSVPVPSEITPATITMASSHGADTLVTEVLDGIQGTGFHFFEFGPLVDVPGDYAAGLDWGWLRLERGQVGIAVSLPEWSTAAVGWTISRVFDAALSLDSAPQALSVRVTRSGGVEGAG